MLKQIQKKNEITNKNLLNLMSKIDSSLTDISVSQIPINIFTLVADLVIGTNV
jgi:hypothetical protein